MSPMGTSDRVKFGSNVRRLRQHLDMTQENLAEASGLDRSYIGGVERGERNPAMTAILHLAAALRVSPALLFEGLGENVPISVAPNNVSAVDSAEGLVIKFKYDQHDAQFILPEASKEEFSRVARVLRDGLGSSLGRSEPVARALLCAVHTWPDANPSDLWTFLINRMYCDRVYHPASHARLNLEQSWKRTSGWALERVLVKHYASFLSEHGVTLKICNKAERLRLLGHINDPRVIPDKADVFLTYHSGDTERLLGVVHVKASIAERRTDDVPLSQALISHGYVSPFWTMDAKSFPAERPVNRGEFGSAAVDQMNDKRRDIEEHGLFSACFSYNKNTMPTLKDREALTRIFTCDFRDPDDHFSQFVIDSLHQRLSC